MLRLGIDGFDGTEALDSRSIIALFYANWCPFCTRFLRLFEEAMQERENPVGALVDISDMDNPLAEVLCEHSANPSQIQESKDPRQKEWSRRCGTQRARARGDAPRNAVIWETRTACHASQAMAIKRFTRTPDIKTESLDPS